MNGVGGHVVSGLAAGGIDALLALAIVLVRRSSGVVNVAQAALATLSAFGCLALVAHGWRFWPAFGVTVALSMVGGVALEALVVAPARRGLGSGPALVTVGLLLAVNGLNGWIWGDGPRRFAGPFSAHVVRFAGSAASRRDLGTVAIAAAVVTVVLLLGRTRAGLGLRAAGSDTRAARELGIEVGRFAALGWALAAGLGAVAGVLAAPAHGVDPAMFRLTLLYALAGAAIGGLDSPGWAVAGAVAVGVGLELLGAYVHWAGTELRPAAALALIVLAVLLRPASVLGRSPSSA